MVVVAVAAIAAATKADSLTGVAWYQTLVIPTFRSGGRRIQSPGPA